MDPGRLGADRHLFPSFGGWLGGTPDSLRLCRAGGKSGDSRGCSRAWASVRRASAGLSPADPPRVVSLEEPELRLEHCIEFVVRGNPPPTLHWLHNGQPLRESRIIRVEYYQEGEVSEGCLLFNKPTHYNNGNYTLVAKNPLGTANQTINGHFLKEPFPGEGTDSFQELGGGHGSLGGEAASTLIVTVGNRTRGDTSHPQHVA